LYGRSRRGSHCCHIHLPQVSHRSALRRRQWSDNVFRPALSVEPLQCPLKPSRGTGAGGSVPLQRGRRAGAELRIVTSETRLGGCIAVVRVLPSSFRLAEQSPGEPAAVLRNGNPSADSFACHKSALEDKQQQHEEKRGDPAAQATARSNLDRLDDTAGAQISPTYAATAVRNHRDQEVPAVLEASDAADLGGDG
jgi:hypothetical protein